jgi:hypothetical protein
MQANVREGRKVGAGALCSIGIVTPSHQPDCLILARFQRLLARVFSPLLTDMPAKQESTRMARPVERCTRGERASRQRERRCVDSPSWDGPG